MSAVVDSAFAEGRYGKNGIRQSRRNRTRDAVPCGEAGTAHAAEERDRARSALACRCREARASARTIPITTGDGGRLLRWRPDHREPQDYRGRTNRVHGTSRGHAYSYPRGWSH